MPTTAAVTPLVWTQSAPPLLSSETTGWDGALLRSWSATSPLMEQPPLDHHYLAVHLGGAKHVSRRRDGAAVSGVVENGSLTLVPAGTEFVWRTRGPIAYAHLYLAPQQVENTLAVELDHEGRSALLIERVGCRDPLLEPLMQTMLAEIQAGESASALRLDSLLESVLIRLARHHVSRIMHRSVQPAALAGYRLRRVLDFIEAGIADQLRLRDLAAAAGSSQYHFSRAFRAATGCSPYRYLIQRRIEYAKVLLLTGAEPLAAVAMRSGFNSQRQLAVMFKRMTGVGPKRFRLLHNARSVRRPQPDDFGDDGLVLE